MFDRINSQAVLVTQFFSTRFPQQKLLDESCL